MTVSESESAAASVTGTTRTSASCAAVTSSGCRSAAVAVTNSSCTARPRTEAAVSASRTAWAPSTRNRPARSRPVRRSSLRAATTRGVRSVPGGVQVPASRSAQAAVPSWAGTFARRHLDERGERGGLADGELGEDLAVDLDTGDLQALDEPVVGHPVRAGRGVDAGDPQLPEVALLGAPVAVGVVERVEHLLLRLAVQPRALPAVAAGQLEGGATLLLSVDRALHACHGSSCLLSGRRRGADRRPGVSGES